jgi:hypothetical protein
MTGTDDRRPTNPAVRHEPSDVDVRGIYATGAALVVLAILIQVTAWLVFRHLDERESRLKPPVSGTAAEERGRLPPPPRLEGLERMEGNNPDVRPGALRPSRQPSLDEYGWVDREAGIVRIPLDRAIKMILEEGGLPSKPESSAGQELPSRANSGRSSGREP